MSDESTILLTRTFCVRIGALVREMKRRVGLSKQSYNTIECAPQRWVLRKREHCTHENLKFASFTGKPGYLAALQNGSRYHGRRLTALARPQSLLLAPAALAFKRGVEAAREVREIAALHSYRFSAFWLRSKCSICSYQLNI